MITLGQFVQVFFFLLILGLLISAFDGGRGFPFAICGLVGTGPLLLYWQLWPFRKK